jgi:beta-glucosidase
VTHGLKGTYFASKTLSGTSKTRTDATVNFNWGSGAPMSGIPADYWSARWTGRVTAPTTGWYGFYLRGDDGMRLSVNNQLIIDKWYNQAATATHLGWVFLNGGQNYPIKLEYYENRGNASVMMSWEGPDFATQLVPSRVLTP